MSKTYNSEPFVKTATNPSDITEDDFNRIRAAISDAVEKVIEAFPDMVPGEIETASSLLFAANVKGEIVTLNFGPVIANMFTLRQLAEEVFGRVPGDDMPAEATLGA